MQNSVLYKKLVDATVKIITQFGRSIIHEERFVNILSDLYPERDNPAVLRIIKSLIQDNLLKDVLNANVKNIEHQVATATAVLSKRYGYDQYLVESILYSLAVGYGTISTAQYNALKALKNKPAKKQTFPPSQNNNPNPTKQNKKNIQPPTKYNSTAKQTAILIWGVIGLLISPIVYALQININKWWPLPTSIVIAIIHFVTVFPVSIAYDNSQLLKPNKIHPALQGGFCSLYILAILFWIAFPFFWGLESVQSYWGFTPNKESFPWIITIFGNIFCALILCTGLSQTVVNFSPNWRKNQGKFSDNFNVLYNNHIFRKGFFAVFAIFIIEGIYFFSIPIVKEHIYKQQIETYNKQINALNHHSDSIRNERIKTKRDLSFAQFKLGESYSACISKIKKEDSFSVYSDRGIDHLIMNQKDYISIVDSIVNLRTDWNNEKITIYMYFSNQRLVAIEFSPEETNSDSLLSVYTSKYGEPESYLSKYVPSEYEGSKSDYYSIAYSIMDDKLVPDQYYWTYKNSILRIDYRKGDYSYKHGHYNDAANIIYFDRAIENFLQKHNEEQRRKAREYQKRQNDSLRLVREAEERQRQEQRLQEELNHQRSMEQI